MYICMLYDRDIDCLPSAVIIAAMLSTEPVFIRPMRAVAGSGAASTGRQREMSAVDPNAEVCDAYIINYVLVCFEL